MSDPQSTDPFLTVAEVATLLKLNQQTVRNWIDAGSLPAVRVGRRVRIPRSALDQLITDGTQGPMPAPPTPAGPSADDFWGGEPVGGAEPDPEFPPGTADTSGTTDTSGGSPGSSDPTNSTPQD